MTDPNQPTIFIDPFSDWSFKRLFGSNESKSILIGLLNQIFKGRKYITNIEYRKNEHPRSSAKQRGVVFDVTCTDADGIKFIIEVQRVAQKFFIDRALYYASKAITEQARKVKGIKWDYRMNEVYVISFLEKFRLPNSLPSAYVHDICLTNRYICFFLFSFGAFFLNSRFNGIIHCVFVISRTKTGCCFDYFS